jgi:EAL domain-containing protein (putative c-di-GMP-specific phosphodiesterase class I)
MDVWHSQVLAGNLHPTAIAQRVAEQAVSLITGAEGALVGVSDGACITYICGSGYLASAIGTRTELDGSIAGLSMRTRSVLKSNDTDNDLRVNREVSRRLGTRSTVVIPLNRDDVVFGVLAVGASRPNAFRDADVIALAQMSQLISVTLGIAEHFLHLDAELVQMTSNGRGAPAGDSASPTADHFVLAVFDPQAATLAKARERIQAVLGSSDPHMVVQPVVDLATDHVVAVEALARFHSSPQRPPNEWFAEAHSVGLGVPFELRAVANALALLDAVPEEVAMAINVGPTAVLDPGMVELIASHDPTRVILELTEHDVVDRYEPLVDTLWGLRRSGVRLSVDDAGAGFASLRHIMKLAPDFIKLDRELVSGIDLDPVRRALTRALLDFAGDTGAQVIAEGVETADELTVIRDFGVPLAQGYHLARPAPINELALTSGFS